MTDDLGAITLEPRGRVLLIGIDRPAKLNGFTPEMMDELVDAYTRLDTDPDLWVGVLFAHGEHFTAGLDLPRWAERMKKGQRRSSDLDRVDPTALGRACTKPIVSAVKGITYTLGIELMLAGGHQGLVVALRHREPARSCRRDGAGPGAAGGNQRRSRGGGQLRREAPAPLRGSLISGPAH